MIPHRRKIGSNPMIHFLRWQNEAATYKEQVSKAREELLAKDEEIKNLHEELDKVKSVLQQTVMKGKPDILATVQVSVMAELVEN